jgi:hypothetical protein
VGRQPHRDFRGLVARAVGDPLGEQHKAQRGPSAFWGRIRGRGYRSGVTSSSKLRKRLADLEGFVDALNKLLGTLQAVQSWDGTRYAPRLYLEPT